MSLINQMLQDLDKRRAPATEGGVLPSHVRVARKRRKSRLLVPIALAAGAAFATFALVWGFSQRAPGAAPAEVVQAVALPPSVPKPAELPPAQLPEEASEPALVTTPTQTRGERTRVASADVIRGDSPTRVPRDADAPAPPKRMYSTALAAAHPEGQPRGTPAGNESVQQEPRRSGAPPKPLLPPPAIDKRTRELTPQQLAENEYRAGATLLNQGRAADAQERFRVALEHHPAHVGARQALFGLMLHAKNLREAEKILHEALKVNPRQPGFAMALARLQIDRGDADGALETLQRAAPAASGSADYLAFLAAVLQRHERHAEAVEHYQAALALAPASGVWQMGLGISLQALNRNAEAQETFRRARTGAALNPELQAFVDERLRQLQQR